MVLVMLSDVHNTCLDFRSFLGGDGDGNGTQVSHVETQT